VTITGTGFTGATAVKFGGTAATSVVVVSGTSITCKSPVKTGVVDVIVTTPSGTSTTSSADHYTYYAALTLTATGTVLPTGTVDVSYTSQAITTYVTASGGTGAGQTYSITSLPAGLGFNATTNVISGTPTTTFSGNVTVKITDSGSNVATCSLHLTINPPVLASSIVMPVNYQTIHGSAFPVSGWYVDTSGVSSIQVNIDGGAWQTATLTPNPTDLPAQYTGYQAVAVDFSYLLDVSGVSDGHHALYVQEVSDYNSTINPLSPYPVLVNVDNHGYIS
jgi:hypothetical protein